MKALFLAVSLCLLAASSAWAQLGGGGVSLPTCCPLTVAPPIGKNAFKSPGFLVNGSGNIVIGGATALTARTSSSSYLTAGTFDSSNYPTGIGANIVGGDTTAFSVAVMGVSVNTLAGNPSNFPGAVAARGYLNSAGNNMFGFTSQIEMYTRGNGSNEFDIGNYSADPSASLPPDLSTGTAATNGLGLYLGAGGTHNSLMAIGIGSDGAGAPSSPQEWLTGIYFFASTIVTNTIRDDSSSTNSIVIHGTHTLGIDISGATITSSAIKTTGFLVDPTGQVAVAGATIVEPFQVKTAADHVLTVFDNIGEVEIEATNLAQNSLAPMLLQSSALQVFTTGGLALTIDASQNIILGKQTTPATAATACTANTIAADTGFIYFCTASGAWKRVAIATW